MKKRQPLSPGTNSKRINKLIAAITLGIYLVQPALALAQPVADPNAAAANKPKVEAAQNGVPVVQITAPTAAGVSRNLYSQFNIGADGLILNNSQIITGTKLAGYITANPNLGGGPARIILNEVTGRDMSRLNGYLEVGGKRADVVIANPNGIIGNGFGFINTSRGILTTGVPVYGGSGSLDAFRVSGGQVVIEGDGLIANEADRVDIITRAAQVNAGIWAKELNIVTGANKVDSQTLNTEKITGEGSRPLVAVDVAALGGMYAGKIRLVGTEQGVGVNSRGAVSAAGELILTQEGKVILGGSTVAGDLWIESQDAFTNSGTLYAKSNAAVSAEGGVENTGIIGGGKDVSVSAQTINSTGIVAAGLQSDGKLSAQGNLKIQAVGSVAANGQNLAGGNMEIKAAAVDLNGSATAANGHLSVQAAGGDISLVNSQVNLGVGAMFETNNTLRSDKAAVKANSLTIRAGTLANTGGSLSAENSINIIAGNINNTASGKISSQNATSLTATGTLANRGTIDGGLTRIEAGTLTNLGTGRIYGDHVAIAANTLNNDAEGGFAAVIAARGQLDIGAQTISNREHALLFSAGKIAIGGSLDANNQAIGQASVLANRSATTEAMGDMTLNAREINNTNEHFSTYVESVGSENIVEYQGSGSPNRYREGTPGVYIFNDESDHLNTPEGWHEQWTAYRYTRTTYETKVATSDPAKLLSGGALKITADTLNNDKSHIIAGGTIDGTIGNLINTQAAGARTFSDSGTVTSYWRHHVSGRDRTGSQTTRYNPAAINQAMTLEANVYKEKTAPAGTGTQVEPKTVYSGNVNAAIPNNSLFILSPNPNAHYLIETDPRFADYRQWISSDYMLKELAYDPAVIQKRLGDGFYEQKLIREQVTELTGRRFLAGYANDEEQYIALMNNGTTFAKEHNLRPGVALSAEQMSQLTSDIVWLVEKDVTLPGGKTTKALVPQLYLSDSKNVSLGASGSLISGNNVQLNIAGDMTNGGAISGRNVVAITAGNIRNLGGRIGGNDVNLQARNNIDVIGGKVEAVNSLTANAGRDLNIVSTTSSSANSQSSRTTIDDVGGLYVTGDNGKMDVRAGRDVNLNAAEIVNSGKAGNTVIAAGNNLNLGTVEESASNRIVWDGDNHRSDSMHSEVGTVIKTQGNLSLHAGNDFDAKAASVESSEGALAVTAGRDVNIKAGKTSVSVDEAHKHKERGFLSSKTITTRDTLAESRTQGSTFSGNTATIMAGNDLNVKGGNIVATGDVNLQAGNNINIAAAQETRNEEHYRREKKSGIFGGGGLGFTIGSRSQKSTFDNQSVNHVGSTVGSIDGKVSILAQKDITAIGSDIIGKKGIDISGRNVNIEAAMNNAKARETYEFKQSGLSVAIGHSAVTEFNKVYQPLQRSSEVSDGRLKALYDYKTYKEGIQNGGFGKISDGAKDIAKNGVKGDFKVSLTIGSSKQKSETTADTTWAQGSTLTSDGDINITATGSGAKDAAGKAADGDLKVIGSTISGKNVTLTAAKDIDLRAAENTNISNTASDSKSAGIGVELSSGIKPSLFIEGSKAKGDINENGTTHNETLVSAQETLTMKAGNDTNLIGAQAKGKTVKIETGGNLNLESQQDTENYKERNSSAGGKVSFGPDGVTGGGSASKGKIDSAYASVKEQTGIYAGTGGFDIKVGGNTDLKGAVIASEASAEKNKISTGTLTWSDLENKAEYKAKSSGTSIGIDKNGKIGMPTPTPSIPVSGDADSTTKSAVSPGTIIVRDNPNQDLSGLSRDTTDALNKLDKIFDKKTVEERQALAAMFGKEAFWLVGEISEKQGWTQGSPEKVALHAIVGGIMAQLGGSSFSSGAFGAGVNELVQNELVNITNPVLRQWVSVIIGAAAARLTGGDALTGATTALYGEKYNNTFHAVKAVLKALSRLGPNRMKLLQRFGFASEEEVLASEANSLKFLEQYNIWQARLGGFRNTVPDFATQATKNSNSPTVYLGKYIEGSAESYEAIAERVGGTYFKLGNWSELAADYGAENMWLINRAFLQQQWANGKNFVLTSNPYNATGYFAKEVEWLQQHGYSFILDGGLWRAVK